MLTQQRLKEYVTYCPDTGIFTWCARPRSHFNYDRIWKGWNARHPNKRAGTVDDKGYIRLKVGGKLYRAHRLAFLYMNGSFPKHHVDHEDHDRTNNRWANIREATIQENGRNRLRSSRNKSGCSGVCWSKKANKWVVHIGGHENRKYLGYFIDMDDAIKVRKKAEKELGYHENHGVVYN